MEAIRYEDFDVLGMIKLKPDEVVGLEDFVMPVKNESGEITHYLSRSPLYYKEGLTYNDRQQQHMLLSSLLTDEGGKRNFVIAENLLNNSAREYFSEIIKKIFFKETKNFDTVKNCFEQDCKLVTDILRGNSYEDYQHHILASGSEITEGRQIELDNKALIDLFVKSLCFKDENKTTVINPGFGCLYLGPFIKQEYGIPYENVYMSLYAKDKSTASKLATTFFKTIDANKSIKMQLKDGDVIIDDFITDPKCLTEDRDFLIIDDNIGTAETINILAKSIETRTGRPVKSMAVQNNWVNYARVNAAKTLSGESTPIPTPAYEEQIEVIQNVLKHNTDSQKITRSDLVSPNLTNPYIYRSPSNFPDYHLLKAAIALIKDGKGEEYEGLLQQYGYGNVNQNDALTCLDIGREIKEKYNIKDEIGDYDKQIDFVSSAENFEELTKLANYQDFNSKNNDDFEQ